MNSIGCDAKPDALGSSGHDGSQGANSASSLTCLACFSKYTPHARMMAPKKAITTPNQNGGRDQNRLPAVFRGLLFRGVVMAFSPGPLQDSPWCSVAAGHKPAARPV